MCIPIWGEAYSREISNNIEIRRWKWRAIIWIILKWSRSTRLKRPFRNGGSCVDLWRTRSEGFDLLPISQSVTKLRLCGAPTRSHPSLSHFIYDSFISFNQYPKKKRKNSFHNIKLKAYRNRYTSHTTKEIHFRVQNERKMRSSSWNKTSIVSDKKKKKNLYSFYLIQWIKLKFEIGIFDSSILVFRHVATS